MSVLRAGLAAFILACLLAMCPGVAQPQSKSGAQAEAPAIPAKIGIAAGFASLDEKVRCGGRRVENLYLTVQNEGNSDLEVRGVRLLAPSDIELCPRKGVFAVAAGRRSIVALPVGTRETPRPGTVPLLVEVELAANVGGSERTDRLLASDKIELRIPGLSDVLKLLGVPTLFLLPGVLVLGAFSLIHPVDSKRLAPNGAGFWIVAVSISIALSWLYTLVMSLVGYERDLTERFNQADVARIWAVSIFIGAAAGAFARCRANRAARETIEATARATAERTLRRKDDPLTLLEKMDRLAITWPLSWYTSSGRGGFLIEPGGSQPRWLVPQATLSDRPTEIAEADWKAARRALSELIKSDVSLADLVRGLRGEAIKPLLPLIWKESAEPEPLDDKASPSDPTTRNFIEVN